MRWISKLWTNYVRGAAVAAISDALVLARKAIFLCIKPLTYRQLIYAKGRCDMDFTKVENCQKTVAQIATITKDGALKVSNT